MKVINTKHASVAALLGIAVLGTVGAAQAAPNRDGRTDRNNGNWNNGNWNNGNWNNGNNNRSGNNHPDWNDNRPGNNRPGWNNRPGNRPGDWDGRGNDRDGRNGPQPGYRDSDIRTFNGTVVGGGSSTMQVRVDNGGTVTVRANDNVRVRNGDRVHVSGYQRNGIIDGAQVRVAR